MELADTQHVLRFVVYALVPVRGFNNLQSLLRLVRLIHHDIMLHK